MRRSPWIFDPRNLSRPFGYYAESYAAVTEFLFRHWRAIPDIMFWYQFGNAVRRIPYVLGARLCCRLGMNFEPSMCMDGAFSFDGMLEMRQGRVAEKSVMLGVEEMIEEVRAEVTSGGEFPTVPELAARYGLPPRLHAGNLEFARLLVGEIKRRTLDCAEGDRPENGWPRANLEKGQHVRERSSVALVGAPEDAADGTGESRSSVGRSARGRIGDLGGALRNGTRGMHRRVEALKGERASGVGLRPLSALTR